MKVIARGREELLRHLEAEAQARCGQAGEYLLAVDADCRLLLVAGGKVFGGDPPPGLGRGLGLVVRGGSVVDAAAADGPAAR